MQTARALVLATTIGAAAAACDRGGSGRSQPAPPAPIESVARALDVDAAALASPVDPPAAAGDLEAEIDAFSTVDACVAQHAHLDALLGDALEAIGYDTFVRDACRVLDAAKAHDAKRCEGIDASSLRRQCASTVAAITGDADACPWVTEAKPALGRDGTCLALAARDPRLCATAETNAARATCEAMVRHDVAPCAALPDRTDAARCRRDAERWTAATPSPDATLAALPAAAGTLRVEAGAGAPQEADLGPDASRGVVLVEQRDGARFELGPGADAGFLAASPHTQAQLGVTIFASRDGKRVEVERAALRVPGRAPLSTPLARSTLVASIEKLDHARGGVVSLTLDGELADSAGAAHVRATVKTFVRDVVSAKALYGAVRPGLGDPGSLR